MERRGVGECHGSFGELVQGVLAGHKKFLVNCRIQNRSSVNVTLTPPIYSAEKEAAIAQSHKTYPKTYKGLRNLLGDLGYHDDCLVEINTELPIGKGLSSSTADMVAGIRAVAQALSLQLRDDYISRMLSEIEPNDGLHFDQTSAYHHTEGILIANVDWVPPLRILGVDQGGVVDTVKFNQRTYPWSDEQCTTYQHLLDGMITALRARDTLKVAEIATASTRIWQAFSPKPDLDAVLALAEQLGAAGIINTHSGTFLGMAFADDASLDEGRLAGHVADRLPGRELQWFRTTGCQ